MTVWLLRTNKKGCVLWQIISLCFPLPKSRSISMARAVQYPCIHCCMEVRPRQEALLCEGCQQWQHRTCSSGITQQQHRMAAHDGTDIDWQCLRCRSTPTPLKFFNGFVPQGDSTHISDLQDDFSALSPHYDSFDTSTFTTADSDSHQCPPLICNLPILRWISVFLQWRWQIIPQRNPSMKVFHLSTP